MKKNDMTVKDLVSKMGRFGSISEIIVECRLSWLERMSVGDFIEKDYGQYADKAVMGWTVYENTLWISIYWG